jgi:hypothetical protein
MRTHILNVQISAYRGDKWAVAIVEHPYEDGRRKSGSILKIKRVDDRGLWEAVRDATWWVMQHELDDRAADAMRESDAAAAVQPVQLELPTD